MIAYVGNNPINFNDPSGLSAAAASMLLGELGSWGRENAGTLAEIWIGFTPAGFYTDLYSAVAGRTPITGDSLSGWERVAILIPGVSEIRNARRVVSAASPISVDAALGKAGEFLKDGIPVRSIDGKTGVQFIQEYTENGQQITKRVGFDLNPNSAHVKELGPHLNLQTQIDGKIQKDALADPHIPIDPKTIRPGDY